MARRTDAERAAHFKDMAERTQARTAYLENIVKSLLEGHPGGPAADLAAHVLEDRSMVFQPTMYAGIRPSVMAFAQMSEIKFRVHDNRDGWSKLTVEEVMDWLRAEVEELQEAIEGGDVWKIVSEAADVSNLSLMASDLAGALVYPGPQKS